MVKALFIYSGADRRRLEKEMEQGVSPDTSFFGYTHTAKDPRIKASYIQINKDSYTFAGGFVRKYRWLKVLYLFFRFYEELTAADVIIIATSAYFELMRLKSMGFLKEQRFVILNLDLTVKLKTYELDKKLIGIAQKIICISLAQKEFLKTQGFLDNKLIFIPMGVDKKFCKSLQREGKLILTIGRDTGRDFATFLEAVRLSGEKAVMICSPQNIKSFENDLPPNLQVFFDLPYRELKRYYEKAKVFVMATKPGSHLIGSDCPGQTAILDTMAYGKPVVATSMPWFKGYFEEGKHIITVPVGDPKALKDAIHRVLENKELKKRLSREGRALVDNKCNSEAMGKAIAELILNIA